VETKFAEVNGIRMRWEEQGTGQPVIYIHGIPTCPLLWRHVIPRVQNARSLAWEMVGYGASIPQGHNRDISVTKQADYLAAWMREIGVEGAVLVGHDLGGGVAQIAAVRYPELVQGLVLMNAICYDSWPIPGVKAMRALGPIVERLPNSVLRLSLYISLFLRGHDNRACAREAFHAHWPHYAQFGGAEALMRQVRSLNVHDTLAIADRLPDLSIPVRLVWGAADQFQKIGYGYRLAYELGATLERIEGGKHFVPEDHADRVAAEVNALLEQLR
jgi:pimeloyl-ACP methyl ester carboxylesterase